VNLNSFILPQQPDLVLSQPGLSAQIAELFHHLSESSEARKSFMESPESLLTEHLGIDLRGSLGVSSLNRIFHRLLNSDPSPLPDQETSSAGRYLPLLRQALAGHSDEAIASALTRGFNVDAKLSTDLRTALQVKVSTELQAIAELELKLAAALEAKLQAETKVKVDALLASHLNTLTITEVELRAKLETILHAQTIAEARLEVDIRTATVTATKAESQIDLVLRADTAIESELQAQIESEIKAATETEIDSDIELDAEAAAQTELEAETEAEADLESSLDAEAEAEAEADAGGPAIRRRKASGAHLSRLDLQRLAGFVVDHPAIAELMLKAPSEPPAGDIR
jgi:hypothetical protein